MLFSSRLAQCKRHLSKLNKRKAALLAEDDSQALPGTELYALIKEIDEYIEGPYAQEVFNYYQKRNPKLIRIQTGEEYTWDDAFGTSFDDVSVSLRHSLVGLVEGGGRYKLKR